MRRKLIGLLVLLAATDTFARAAFDELTPLTVQEVFSYQRLPAGVQLQYEAPELSWTTEAEGDVPILQGAGEEYIPGAPRLPLYSRLIAVPAGMDLRVRDIQIGWAATQQRKIAWNNGAKEDAEYDESAYFSVAEQSQQTVTVGRTGRWRDLRMAQVIVRPMMYDAVTNEVRMAETIDIQFDFVPSEELDTYNPPGVSEALLPLYRSYVMGAEDELDELEPERGTYLIIVPDAYEELTEDFVEWKSRLGYHVIVAPTSQTGTDYDDIHDYLDDLYESASIPLDYVLILGDEDTPANIEAPTIPGSPGHNPTIAADYKYCFERNQTNIADVLPRYFVGRLSVDNVTQLNTVLAKTMFYEMTPGGEGVGLDRFEEAMFIACLNPGVSTGMTKRWVAAKMLADGGITNVEDLYDSYSNGLSLTTVTNTINAGVSWINYRGYGAYDSWAGPYWGNAQMDALDNEFLNPIVTSMVCGGAAFDRPQADPCFGEKFIRQGTAQAPTGAVAFMGPSELDTHTKWNNAMDGGFYQSMYDNDLTTLYQCLMGAKLELLRCYPNSWNANGNSTNSVWFYWHTYNLLGDPALQVRREVPFSFNVDHASTINDNDTYFPVHVTNTLNQPIENARVVLVENGADIIASVLTDESGNASLMLPGGPYNEDLNLTVSRRDAIPYLDNLDGLGAPGISLVSVDVEETEGNQNNNLDGYVNPGEVADIVGEFHVEDPDGIDNLSVTVSLPQGGGEVTVNTEDFGDVGYNATIDLTEIMIAFDPEVQYGQLIPIRFTFEGDDFEQSHLIQYDGIEAPALTISEMAFDDEWGPGDVGDLNIELLNSHPALSSGEITGTLISLSSYAIIVQPVRTWNSITPGGSSLPVAAFQVMATESAYPGRELPMTLQLETDDGYQTYIDVVLTVDGGDEPTSPTGPAGPGYYMFEWFSADEFDSGMPFLLEMEYQSLTINGSQVNGLVDTGNNQDQVVDINLPFEFSYWGETYDRVTLCSNGWMSFEDEPNPYFRNRPIPGPLTPYAAIMPFWDDLKNGTVYTYHNEDEAWFGIEWYNWVPYNGGSTMRFQVRLLDPVEWGEIGGQGVIIMMYDAVYNNDGSENYATVGMTSPDGNDGIQFTFANEHDPTAHDIEDVAAIVIAIGEGGGLDDPWLLVQPPIIQTALQQDHTGAIDIALQNSGDMGLEYNILVEGIWPEWSLENPGTLGEEKDSEGGSDELDEQGGPDGFGYRFIDSNNRYGPFPGWLDIASEENEVEMFGEDNDPKLSNELELPFDFPFYGMNYSTFWICDAGYMVFVDPEGNGEVINTDLPRDYSPLAGIFPFWDNIGINSDDAKIYTQAYTDSFVVTWANITHNLWETNGGPYTFQVLLTTDGAIHVRYDESMHPSYRSSTLGIQDHTGEYGITVAYGQPAESYIEAGLSVRFTPPAFFHLATTSGHLDGEEILPLTMDVSAENLPVGVYVGRMLIWCDDTEQEMMIPGTMIVTEGPPSAAPRISHLVGETAMIGDQFHPFALDPCVFDTAFADDEIIWAAYGDPAIEVTIDEDRIAHPEKVDTLWVGTATITYRATNPALAYTEHQVTYSTGGGNNAPRFDTVSPTDFKEPVNLDSQYDFSVEVSDPDEDEVTVNWFHGDEDLGEGLSTNVTFDAIQFDSVRAVASDGTTQQTHTWWIDVQDLAAPEEFTGLPSSFTVESLYPNPFNASMVVAYALPRTADVELRVFNLLGQEVARRNLIQMPAGHHRIAFNGEDWASGVYFLSWKAGGVYQVHKAILLK